MFVSIKINYLESNTTIILYLFYISYFACVFPKDEEDFEKLSFSGKNPQVYSW